MIVNQQDLEMIFGDVLKKDRLVIPMDVLFHVTLLPNYQNGLATLFYSCAKFEVNQFFDKHNDKDENQLEVLLHFEMDEIIDYLTEQLNEKLNYNDEEAQRHCIVFNTWAICRIVVKTLVYKGYIRLATKYYKNLNEFVGMIRHTDGLTRKEIEEKVLSNKGVETAKARWELPNKETERLKQKYLKIFSEDKHRTMTSAVEYIFKYENSEGKKYRWIAEKLSEAVNNK